MLRPLSALFMVVLLAQEPACFALSSTPDSASSILYICRPKHYLGSASRVQISINGVDIEKLSNGTKMKCILFSEGTMEISVKSKSPYSRHSYSLEVAHGNEYYLQVSWPGAYSVKISPLELEEGANRYYDKSLYKTGQIESIVKEDLNTPLPVATTKAVEKSAPKESIKPIATGSGFGISNDGYITTNYHVVKESEFVYVKGINGDFTKKFKARVAVKDPLNDLVILKIDDEAFIGWKDSIPYTIKTNLAEVGENIFVLGYPLTTTMGDEIKLTNGIISSKTGYKGLISVYQISAPVQPGSSGGPLFDNQGNLIGIVAAKHLDAKHLDAENVSYAIKSNYLTNLIDLLPERPALTITSGLNGKSLPEQVKMVKSFIVLIEVH